MISPLMYKGFIITNKDNKTGGYNFNGVVLNNIYNTFEEVKLVIDNLK